MQILFNLRNHVFYWVNFSSPKNNSCSTHFIFHSCCKKFLYHLHVPALVSFKQSFYIFDNRYRNIPLLRSPFDPQKLMPKRGVVFFAKGSNTRDFTVLLFENCTFPECVLLCLLCLLVNLFPLVFTKSWIVIPVYCLLLAANGNFSAFYFGSFVQRETFLIFTSHIFSSFNLPPWTVSDFCARFDTGETFRHDPVCHLLKLMLARCTLPNSNQTPKHRRASFISQGTPLCSPQNRYDLSLPDPENANQVILFSSAEISFLLLKECKVGLPAPSQSLGSLHFEFAWYHQRNVPPHLSFVYQRQDITITKT